MNFSTWVNFSTWKVDPVKLEIFGSWKVKELNPKFKLLIMWTLDIVTEFHSNILLKGNQVQKAIFIENEFENVS